MVLVLSLGGMFGWVALLDAMLGRSVSVFKKIVCAMFSKRIAYFWLHDF